VLCDSSDEVDPSAGLEQRIVRAFREPSSIERFGGWSLGESTHLINDAWLFEQYPEETYQLYLLDPQGDLSLPVWVDHVGSANTHRVIGRIEPTSSFPVRVRLPQIPVAEPPLSAPAKSRKSRAKS
jgi:CRISPR-associated protein Cas5t